MHVRILLLIVAWSVVLLAPGRSRAERWEIVEGEKGNEVVFHSKATLESFEGRTDRVSGWIEYAPNAEGYEARWRIDVDLASLDTGIGLRNTHMRENHLHTEEFPVARFEGSTSFVTAVGALENGEERELKLMGAFLLHGVIQEREIPVLVRPDPTGVLEVRTEFTVSLADHDIPLPKFLMMKLADTQRITAEFRAHPATEEIE